MIYLAHAAAKTADERTDSTADDGVFSHGGRIYNGVDIVSVLIFSVGIQRNILPVEGF